MGLPSLAGLSLGPPTGVCEAFDDDVHGKILKDLVLGMLRQGELLYGGPVCRAIIAYAKACNAGLTVPARNANDYQRQAGQVRLSYAAFQPLYDELLQSYLHQMVILEDRAIELRAGLKVDEDPSFPRDRHKLLVYVELMEYFRQRMIKKVSAGTSEGRYAFNTLDVFWRTDFEIAVPALLHWKAQAPVDMVVPTDALFSQKELYERLYDRILAENPTGLDIGAQLQIWRRRTGWRHWGDHDALLKLVRILARYDGRYIGTIAQRVNLSLVISTIESYHAITELVSEILDIFKEEVLVGEQGKRTITERHANWLKLYSINMFGFGNLSKVRTNAKVQRKFIELHYMNFLSSAMWNARYDEELLLAVLNRFDWLKPGEARDYAESPDERAASEKMRLGRDSRVLHENDRVVQLGLIIDKVATSTNPGLLADPAVDAKLRQMVGVLDGVDRSYLARKLASVNA